MLSPSGTYEELELVPVRALEEDLLGAVRTAGGAEFDALLFQELGGFADVVDAHGEMAGARPFVQGNGKPAANQMQLLVSAISEPTSGEIESRTVKNGKTDGFAIETSASFDRSNEESDVVKFKDLH
jgi:hypothetical protein